MLKLVNFRLDASYKWDNDVSTFHILLYLGLILPSLPLYFQDFLDAVLNPANKIIPNTLAIFIFE